MSCSTMEEDSSIPYRKPHFPFLQQNPANPIRAQQGKSSSSSSSSHYMAHFLLKALFFAIIVVALPLLPSQAPDFFTHHTVLTKLWELIHLVFIGLVVSYGLFSRRNADLGGIETLNNPNAENSESFMPGMFPASSSFDDGFEIPCRSLEKIVGLENWGCHESSAFNAPQSKPNLSFPENGGGISCGYKEKNVAQAWSSQYLQGEPMVFVAQPNCGLDEWAKPRSIADSQPLGLPIRSLKSGVSSEFVTRFESGLGSMDCSNGSDRRRNGKFGDLGPLNLEEKLTEATASPSLVHCRSSSGRTEMGKSVGGAARRSHFRPLSVDEAQFESLKNRSFRSTLSFSSESSSQISSMSCWPKEDSFARSKSSEALNSKVGNLKKRKSSQGSSPSGMPSPPKPTSEKVLTSTLHSRAYSFGSFHEEGLRRSSSNYSKELSGSGSGSGSEGDRSSSKEAGQGWLRSDVKPASLTKSSSRGRSVRTIRGSRLTAHDKVEKICDNGEDISMRKDIMLNGGTKNKSVENGTMKVDFDSPLHMPKPAFPKYQKKEMPKEFCGNVAVESEEDSESEAEHFEVSSDSEDEDDDAAVTAAAAAAAVTCNSVNVAGPDSDEVDKKAGEFIAKFREQIRLQKVASMDRSRGLGISGNGFR